MVNKSIYLDEESTDILNGMMRGDKKFSLSTFVQEKLKEDVAFITPEQIDQKIKIAEITLEDQKTKIAHLRRVRPLSVERQEVIKDTLKPKSIAIGILKRKITEGTLDHELVAIAKVHSEQNGINYKELIREAKQ